MLKDLPAFASTLRLAHPSPCLEPILVRAGDGHRPSEKDCRGLLPPVADEAEGGPHVRSGRRRLAQQLDLRAPVRLLPLIVVGAFALLALGMAAVGVYGIVNYAVASRSLELGIRMALGATRGQIVELVVGQGARLALVGLVLGTVGALVLARVLRSLLFGVQPADPETLFGVAALLALVLGLAVWSPARRAARVDPAVSLKSE